MAFVAVEVGVDDREAVRRAHADLAHALERIGFDADRVGHLIAVAWELWTNAERFSARGITTALIDQDGQFITLMITGPAFDSVARASQPGARGLETSAWRLAKAGCTWSYAYANGCNEIRIDYGGGTMSWYDEPKLTEREEGAAMVWSLSGDWTRDLPAHVKEDALKLLGREITRPLVLDLTNVAFIDSWAEELISDTAQGEGRHVMNAPSCSS